MHEKLLRIVRKLETDFEPFGKVVQDDRPDCSCGCRHFLKLAHEVGNDWGVCENSESPRSGLLTFEHQGCLAFEPIKLDRSLSDFQLREIIADASELLKDRRRERNIDLDRPSTPPMEAGEFIYEVRTSYFPRIRGHFPKIYRLEQHEDSFVPIPVETRVSGTGRRPLVISRQPARNGEVFKIVRENGEFSYQVPFNGEIFNLRQYANLSRIGVGGIESLRRFLERVECEVFEKIVTDSRRWLTGVKREPENSRDRVQRWRQKQFRPDETPANTRERREMLKEEVAYVESAPNQIIEVEAFLEWLDTVDRSKPTLASIPVPIGKGPKQSGK